ncbi:MAG: carboxyl transferase domain-containing protein [Christensenella sp.]
MGKPEEFRQKNADILGGNEQNINAQHTAGKKTARERINGIIDKGSFIEIEKFVKRTFATPGFEAVSEAGEGVVCGYGTVEDRPVFIYAQDYTVLSGSLCAAHASKIIRVMDMAVKNGVPLIGVLDSGGARISEGVAAIESTAAILNKYNEISGVVPTVSIVAGPCIGTAAYIAAVSDFTLMVAGISMVALHGPQIYASALGKEIDTNEFFGAENHNEKTGIAQFMCANEDECALTAQKLISFLPSNNLDEAPYGLDTDDLNRQLPFNGEEVYDAKAVIAAIADNGDVLEVQEAFATDMITMFGRINGNACGFVANADIELSGQGAKKAARFIEILDAFNLPIVTLVNCGGSQFDVAAEQNSLISDVAHLISAYAQAGTPKLTLVTGKAIGDGFAVMCPKALGADMAYAWSTAEISALPCAAGALILYEDEISSAEDSIAAKEKMEEKYALEYANPWQAAAQGVIDDVIEPAHTRQILVSALEMTISKRESKLPKKHGVLPL